jgi:hypothetical protein
MHTGESGIFRPVEEAIDSDQPVLGTSSVARDLLSHGAFVKRVFQENRDGSHSETYPRADRLQRDR